MKWVISSSFFRAAYSYSSIRKMSTKILVLSKVYVVLLTANCWLLLNSFANQLLLNTQQQEEWLVPIMEYPVQSPPKAYLEPSHTSKRNLL